MFARRLQTAVLLSSFLSVPLLLAQGNLGGLTGSLADSSGAAVPGARITLSETATGQDYSTVSNENGYRFSSVNPGTYRLTVEVTGFKKLVREPLQILTASVGTLDLTLEPGSVTETLTVTSESALLETSSPEVATVLERGTLMDLPIQLGNNTTAQSGRRQPENFIFLTPGVTGSSWEKQVNGAPGFTQEVLIDGVSAQLSSNPGFLAQTAPPYDAIQEFKVQNTLYPAEFGRGFGVINYTMKSGTNEFHGALFEFFRNDKLDARNFFQRVRPPVRYNEFGGEFGGPVWIPKIYDGRNKTFFNVAYSGLRNIPAPTSGLTSLPPAAFRNGDFSSYVDASGALIPIYDPATTAADGSRQPFPGNIIPAARLGGVAKRSLALLPQPDLPGYSNNYIIRQRSPVTDDVWSIKGDHSLGTNQRLSFSYWQSYNLQKVNTALGAEGGPYGFQNNSLTTGRNWRANYHAVLSPSLVYFAGAGFTKSNPVREIDDRKGNQILQIPGIDPDLPGFATFTVSNPYGSLGLGNSDQQPNDPAANLSYVFVNNLTWATGRHQFKFGGEFRWMRFDNYRAVDSGGLSGVYTFNNLSTSNLTDPRANALGNAWASFLLGDVYSGQRLIPPQQARIYRSNFYAWFVEDVMKLSRKFTVTLGLRQELPRSPWETTAGWSFLDTTQPNALAGGRPGVLSFVGPGVQLTDNYYGAWSPRVGLAYQVTPRTVIRTGFGLFYAPTNAADIGQTYSVFNAGYTYPQVFAQVTNGRAPVFNIDSGVPAANVTLPNSNPYLRNGQTIDAVSAGAEKPGTAASWTFNIQQELPKSFVLDVGYVGQRAYRISSGLENLNQVDVRNLSLGATLSADINSAAARAAGISAPYPGFTGSVAQALRPYPQFTGINNDLQPNGWSTYNSLQTRLQKRYSNGVSFLLSYTWSKTLVSGGSYTGRGVDAASSVPLDTRNRILEKRLAAFDIPHNVVISWTYALPFGRGRRYMSNPGRGLDLLAGGWEFTAIQRYASGTPLNISGGGVIPLFNSGNRPNRIPGVDPINNTENFDPAINRYLNSAAFSQPAPYTFGTGAPNYGDIRAFGMKNEDVSIHKNFRLFENHRIQFRAEAFNVFNRVVFGSPDNNTLSANFGRITSTLNQPRSVQFVLRYVF